MHYSLSSKKANSRVDYVQCNLSKPVITNGNNSWWVN